MTFVLNGCAAPIVGVLTIDEMFSVVSLASSVLTGKSFGDHAMDVATGDDCRLFESVVRVDRKVCEPAGSLETKKDYKGVNTIVSYLEDNDLPNPMIGLKTRPVAYENKWYRASFD
jgi:hypothetical protein